MNNIFPFSKSPFDKTRFCLLFCSALLMSSLMMNAQTSKPAGTLEEMIIQSSVLKENKCGLDPNRSVMVYLPPGYSGSSSSKKLYPVVYFLHNIYWSPDKMFSDGKVLELLERGFNNDVVNEFILVVADFSVPGGAGSLYENSPVTGRWLDFIVGELVPAVDRRFRTIPNRESRAVVGEFMGGRGALKLGMVHAGHFAVVYAMHPVATGNGQLPWTALDIEWSKILVAKSTAEVVGLGRTTLFVTICQAFLPNTSRPPFYCDFFFELKDGKPAVHPDNLARAQQGFHLEESVRESGANLRSLRGLAFDWGRFDAIDAHVFSNRQFSRRLHDLGISHEAEEHSGGPFDHTWTDDGRFYARVLPFLSRYLVFASTPNP